MEETHHNSNSVLSPPPRPARPYDIIIVGASGFTGKYVLKEALKFLHSSSSAVKSLAIAGRNPKKLRQSLSWATTTSIPSAAAHDDDIPILRADTSDFGSILRVTAQARVVLNCVGPFRLHGEPVVRACIQNGTDYLDICGEPEFMEKMEVEYHEKAKDKGCLVVSACGFDSVPAELGFTFNSRHFQAPNSVQAYLVSETETRTVVNFASYESAVLSVANAHFLRQLRKLRPNNPRLQIPGPPPPKGPTIEQQKKLGLWAVRYPSADTSVVRRTLTILTENPSGLAGVNESADHISKRKAFWPSVKPAHFGVKISAKSWLGILRYIIVGLFIGLLGKDSFGRKLLLKFPSIFSVGLFRKKGPTEAEISSASFKMWFVGHGFSDSKMASLGNNKPDIEVITRVMGPEMGYVSTPIIMVQCALIILSQRHNLPKGGVYPPGIVFGPTDLQQRLQQNGISFDFISKRALPS